MQPNFLSCRLKLPYLRFTLKKTVSFAKNHDDDVDDIDDDDKDGDDDECNADDGDDDDDCSSLKLRSR